MKQIPDPVRCALALALMFAPACGDDTKGSGTSASGLSTITSATAPTTGATTETSSGPSSMSEVTDSGASASHTGTTGITTTDDPSSSSTPTTTSTSTSTSTTGTTRASVTDSTTAADKVPCDSEETVVSPVPPSVLLVLDKSGSMSMESWDHDGKPQTPNVTRWHSLHEVVEGVVTSFDAAVDFGVKLFPKYDAGSYENTGACIVDPGVEVPIAPMNAQAVLAGVPPIDFEVLGGTPMETGLKLSYDYLKTLDPTTQRFAILVADGEISITCGGENFLEAQAAVEDAFNLFQIPTYVVGIDVDPSTSEQLATLANAGGKPKPGIEPFYQTSNQAELLAAIEQIIKDTLSCVVAVDPAPSEPELFEVWIGGEPVPQAADCAGDGWVWSQEHTEVTLCGSACDMLKETGKVEALYFCNPG